MIILRQKQFHLNEVHKDPNTGKWVIGNALGNGQGYTSVDSNGKATTNALMKNQQTAQAQVAKEQARTAQRKAIKDTSGMPQAVGDAAKKARVQGYNAGVKSGQNQVGLLGGAKNTWNGMTNTQKGLAIGGAAAATIGTGMLIARNRKKRKEAERELELERARNRR